MPYNPVLMPEPHVSFMEAAMKIGWAGEQIKALDQFNTSFQRSRPWNITSERDPRSNCFRLSVGLQRKCPLQFPLTAGDVVSNLRAALDYTWMGLVRKANSETGRAGRRYFPIAGTKSELARKLVKEPVGENLDAATEVVLNRVCAHREFDAGGNRLLAALNDLSNLNKHSLLPTTVSVVKVHDLVFGGVSITSIEARHGTFNAVELGETEPELQYGRADVAIVFGTDGRGNLVDGEPVLQVLAQLHAATLTSLRAFCEAFPSQHNPTFGDGRLSQGTQT